MNESNDLGRNLEVKYSKITEKPIPNNENYKTLKSISKTKEFPSCSNFIRLLDFIFDICDNTDVGIAFDQLKTIEKAIFDEYFSFIVDVLCHYTIVRPKQRRFILALFSMIINEIEGKKDELIEILSHSDYFYIQRYPELLTIFNSSELNLQIKEDEYIMNKSLETEYSLDVYEKGTLESIIKDDDINELKNYINTNSSFFNKELKFKIIDTNPMKSFDTIIELNLLQFSAFYGSFNVFQFLKCNDCQYGENSTISEMSIAGGNFNIIKICEQEGITFNTCFERSVQYHHIDISEWLLANYKCKSFFIYNCLLYCDYRTFLFLIYNNADVNDYYVLFNPNDTITKLCSQKIINIDLIKLLIEKGADINKSRVLLYECKKESANIQLMKLILENGANPNNGNPLFLLCLNRNMNIEAYKILIDHNANINQKYNQRTPLLQLCINKKAYRDKNLDIIQLLINNGANVNEECNYLNWFSITAIHISCFNEEADLELLKLLIKNGSNVNKLYKKVEYNFNIIESPLGMLCRKPNTNEESIRFLLEHGANINIEEEDSNGKTSPYHKICLYFKDSSLL